MRSDLFRYQCGELLPVNCQSAACRDPALLGTGNQKGTHSLHFRFQQPGRAFQPFRLQGIGTDKLGKLRIMVGRRKPGGLHFPEDYRHAPLRQLPRRFAPGQSCANYGYSRCIHHSVSPLFFSIGFSKPHPSVAQYNLGFFPFFTNKALPHRGHFSATGSSQETKSHSG